MKVLADSGYNHASYLLFFNKYIEENKDQFIALLNESHKTGDLTYMMIFVTNMVKICIYDLVDKLNSKNLPVVEKGQIKIIEKTIEVPVEKIVEVEKVIEVEKIVEVPIEKIIEVEKVIEVPVDRTINVPVDRIVEKIVEVPVEIYIEKFIEIPVERIVEVEKIIEVEKLVEIEKLVEVPVDKIVEVEKVVETVIEKEVPVERIIERVIEVEKEQKKTPIFSRNQVLPAVSVVQANDLAGLKDLDDEELAKRLLFINPYLKKDQASFYAHHRVDGCYYTINQFKEFADCVYETARTSMDYLAECGFYRKELFKNKYVYTPISLNTKEDNEL